MLLGCQLEEQLHGSIGDDVLLCLGVPVQHFGLNNAMQRCRLGAWWLESCLGVLGHSCLNVSHQEGGQQHVGLYQRWRPSSAPT